MGLNSFGHEVVMEAGLVRVMFVNIDFPELAASSDRDDARPGVNEPLLALAVPFLDGSGEAVHAVRLVFNRQRFGPLVGGHAFLQGELSVFLASPRPCQQSAVHGFTSEGSIQGELAGS